MLTDCLIRFGLAGLLFSTSALSAPSYEVVQSVPVETTLAVPGIRQTQEVWVEMINGASKSIDLEEFYISRKPGESLDPVLASLKNAAARGVQIRLLLDAKFLKTYPHEAEDLLPLANVAVKTVDFSSKGGIQHAKYFVIDQARAFVGSQNFDWLALSHIHEVGMRLEDPQVSAGLEQVFAMDWEAGTPVSGNQVSSNQPINPGSTSTPVASPFDLYSVFKLVASPTHYVPSGMQDSISALLDVINSAKQSLRIQMYEYSTHQYAGGGSWKVLDEALRKAAARGVKIEFALDHNATKAGAADLKGLSGIQNIEIRLITIPQWSGGPLQFARLIHSKYLIADDSASWIGTENWQDTYFTGSRNVGVIVQSADVAKSMNSIFTQLWTSHYALRY